MNNWSEIKQALTNPILDSRSAALEQSELTLSSLDHKVAIDVVGPDSKTFLQGQLSCDLDEVDLQQWRLGAHCNHKGRMLSSFRCSAMGDEHIRLYLRQDIADNAHKALAKYAIFSKAELSIDHDCLGIGLSGKNAKAQLEQWQLDCPSEGKSALCKDAQILNIGQERYEIWAQAQAINNLFKQLKSEAVVADSSYWKLLDIRAGIAEIEAEVEESFIPQMLNFNELGGISYQKGCYTGQEIIARMQYRGNLKRHTVRLFFKANDEALALTKPRSGDELYTANRSQSVGELVNIAYCPSGIEALAVIKDDAADAPLALSPEGPWNFTIESLPYAIT